ncbi:MAG TPA: YciI family protein [Polyangiaceae bacterium]|nr:YciI family protein [Polyangiaceae bacterium]
MKEFILIYKGGDPEWRSAPAEQKQQTMAAWGKWLEALGARGQLVNGGSPLEFEGKRVAAGGVITDIAASEMKELVSGYSIIKAKDYAEAAQLAKDCPIFRMKYATVEVRGIGQM